MYNSYDTLGSGLAIGAIIGIAFIVFLIAMIHRFLSHQPAKHAEGSESCQPGHAAGPGMAAADPAFWYCVAFYCGTENSRFTESGIRHEADPAH